MQGVRLALMTAVVCCLSGVIFAAEWLENPDWTTNSDFMVVNQITMGDDNESGLPTAYSTYEYDTYQVGSSIWCVEQEDILEDAVCFHSSVEPSVGVHLSVEAKDLDNTDFFNPGELWVGGVQRYNLLDLADDESVSFNVLLSISTEVVPEPGTLGLLVLGGLILLRHRRSA